MERYCPADLCDLLSPFQTTFHRKRTALKDVLVDNNILNALLSQIVQKKQDHLFRKAHVVTNNTALQYL